MEFKLSTPIEVFSRDSFFHSPLRRIYDNQLDLRYFEFSETEKKAQQNFLGSLSANERTLFSSKNAIEQWKAIRDIIESRITDYQSQLGPSELTKYSSLQDEEKLTYYFSRHPEEKDLINFYRSAACKVADQNHDFYLSSSEADQIEKGQGQAILNFFESHMWTRLSQEQKAAISKKHRLIYLLNLANLGLREAGIQESENGSILKVKTYANAPSFVSTTLCKIVTDDDIQDEECNSWIGDQWAKEKVTQEFVELKRAIQNLDSVLSSAINHSETWILNREEYDLSRDDFFYSQSISEALARLAPLEADLLDTHLGVHHLAFVASHEPGEARDWAILNLAKDARDGTLGSNATDFRNFSVTRMIKGIPNLYLARNLFTYLHTESDFERIRDESLGQLNDMQGDGSGLIGALLGGNASDERVNSFESSASQFLISTFALGGVNRRFQVASRLKSLRQRLTASIFFRTRGLNQARWLTARMPQSWQLWLTKASAPIAEAQRLHTNLLGAQAEFSRWEKVAGEVSQVVKDEKAAEIFARWPKDHARQFYRLPKAWRVAAKQGQIHPELETLLDAHRSMETAAQATGYAQFLKAHPILGKPVQMVSGLPLWPLKTFLALERVGTHPSVVSAMAGASIAWYLDEDHQPLKIETDQVKKALK